METTKVKYIPPKVKTIGVTLENTIAVQSPIKRLDLIDWEPDETVMPDTGDILLPI